MVGVGRSDAKVVLVGEAPGYEEENQGVPFIGPSGRQLDGWLKVVGIGRGDCYVTNVFKYRCDPRKVSGETRVRCEEEVRGEVRAIKPNVIVALGEYALKALTPYSGIGKWRGSVIATDLGLVVPTYHPAYVLRSFQERDIALLDMKKAKRLAGGGRWKDPRESFEMVLSPSLEQVLEFLGRPRKLVACDIETIGRHVRCIGFAWSPTQAICIPFTSTPPLGTEPANHWSLEDEESILCALRSYLENPEIRKIFQNFPFDATIIARDFGIPIRGMHIDTLALHHCNYPEWPKSLDFLTSIYTDIPRYSDYNAGNDMETWVYNCTDCISTFRCGVEIEREAVELGVLDFYQRVVHPAIYALTRCQNRGVRVDAAVRDTMARSYEEELEGDLAAVEELAEEPLNPNSPKQLVGYFYGKLGVAPVYKEGLKPTVDEDALRVIARKNPKLHPLVEKILSYREKRKLVSTYLKQGLYKGRVRSSYSISGTKNGRISSGKTIDGEGGNMQNNPRSSMRRIYRPDIGHRFIKADLSQAEVRIVAWTAPCPLLVERFTNDPDFDIHRWNAGNIYRVSEQEVTKDQRSIAKVGVHGGNYGLGARKAASEFGVGYRDARDAIEAYRRALPELGEWWERVRERVVRTRVLTNPFGRRRYFMGRVDDEMMRSAYAFIPQSTVADVINMAFVETERELDRIGGYPLLQVHDEICYSVPEGNVEEAVGVIRRALEKPIRFPDVEVTLTIPAEIHVGKDWWDAQE